MRINNSKTVAFHVFCFLHCNTSSNLVHGITTNQERENESMFVVKCAHFKMVRFACFSYFYSRQCTASLSYLLYIDWQVILHRHVVVPSVSHVHHGSYYRSDHLPASSFYPPEYLRTKNLPPYDRRSSMMLKDKILFSRLLFVRAKTNRSYLLMRLDRNNKQLVMKGTCVFVKNGWIENVCMYVCI